MLQDFAIQVRTPTNVTRRSGDSLMDAVCHSLSPLRYFCKDASAQAFRFHLLLLTHNSFVLNTNFNLVHLMQLYDNPYENTETC